MKWIQVTQQLDQAAAGVFALLQARQNSGRPCQIVLAESCTAGLISGTLGRVAGISEFLAGSAVVYQIETKARWLGVDHQLLIDPGPVSRIVAEQMAEGVLRMTPHASISMSITGHLGPNAPPELDGVVWCTVTETGRPPESTSLKLPADYDENSLRENIGLEVRRHRQKLAALWALRFLSGQLTA